MTEDAIPATIVGETVAAVSKRNWRRPILAIGAGVVALGAGAYALARSTRNPSSETETN